MKNQQVAVFCDGVSGDILEVYVTSTLDETKKFVLNEYTENGTCDLVFSSVYEEEVSEDFEIFNPN